MTQPQLALTGAGSTVCARNLLGDIRSFPELAGADVRLPDIDRERLDVIPGGVGQAASAQPRLAATLDRAQVLSGANFVIDMIQMAEADLPAQPVSADLWGKSHV